MLGGTADCSVVHDFGDDLERFRIGAGGVASVSWTVIGLGERGAGSFRS